MKRKIESKTVYVLYVTHHVDCYKRAESFTIIQGVFDTQDKAIVEALKSQEMRDLIDDYEETEMDELLKRYQENEIPKTKEDCFKLFQMLCKIQTSKEPTYTAMASGSYFKVKCFTIQ
jgi:dsRNA-specific ribonuclease